jgi:hypothetical protein
MLVHAWTVDLWILLTRQPAGTNWHAVAQRHFLVASGSSMAQGRRLTNARDPLLVRLVEHGSRKAQAILPRSQLGRISPCCGAAPWQYWASVRRGLPTDACKCRLAVSDGDVSTQCLEHTAMGAEGLRAFVSIHAHYCAKHKSSPPSRRRNKAKLAQREEGGRL